MVNFNEDIQYTIILVAVTSSMLGLVYTGDSARPHFMNIAYRFFRVNAITNLLRIPTYMVTSLPGFLKEPLGLEVNRKNVTSILGKNRIGPCVVH